MFLVNGAATAFHENGTITHHGANNDAKEQVPSATLLGVQASLTTKTQRGGQNAILVDIAISCNCNNPQDQSARFFGNMMARGRCPTMTDLPPHLIELTRKLEGALRRAREDRNRPLPEEPE